MCLILFSGAGTRSRGGVGGISRQSRASKRRATHNRYFLEFDALVGSVEEALAFLATHSERIKAVFDRYVDHLTWATDAALATAA
jgi:hypothetical protein